MPPVADTGLCGRPIAAVAAVQTDGAVAVLVLLLLLTQTHRVCPLTGSSGAPWPRPGPAVPA